ncbi:hypothetical protein [Anaeromicropila populeti]|uniref:Uncharacterized protein n=1 Tax=Anaeromicropila populeti TaxID=37658 RepID=A0A1I6HP18_9FIRM|nr:hypothetical protein [Anaeromicropila populeti]SFR56195.1 hypothetical protein SAMN05661086_00137 [Anaeromicropila populeti]
MNQIEYIRDNFVGFEFITLNSTKEGLKLYRRYEFEELESDINFAIEKNDLECIQMYLPLDLEE